MTRLILICSRKRCSQQERATKTHPGIPRRPPCRRPSWSGTGANVRRGPEAQRTASRGSGGDALVATPCICRRRCGAAWARGTRRAATGSWRSRCSSAARCAPSSAVAAAGRDFVGRPVRPPRCFLRGTPSSRYEWSQIHRLVGSCRPASEGRRQC